MKKYIVQLILIAGLLVCSSNTVNADWVQTNGPVGGSIYALAVSGNNIFAGTYGGGVFLSTNNGTSWTAASTGLANDTVYTLAVSGSNIFAGTFGGVYLSTDNGTSWSTVSTGLTNDFVLSLAVSGNNIFAGTYGGGVFLSTNNGTSWTAVNSGLTNTVILSLAVSGSNIFAGTNDGVFLSTNNGTSWTAVNSNITNMYGDLSNTYIWSLVMRGSLIFAGTNTGGIFCSVNNGTSWTSVNNGFPIAHAINEDPTVFLTVSDSTIFAWSDANGVYLSTNNGTNWKAFNTGLPVHKSGVPGSPPPYGTSYGIRTLAVSGGTIFAGFYNGEVWSRPLSEMTGVTNPKPQRGALSQANLKILSPSRTNPNVTIEFSLHNTDQVTATMYDLSGHEIASLVDKQLGSGPHSVTWDTRNRAPGCYAVRMRVGANSYVKSIPVFR